MLPGAAPLRRPAGPSANKTRERWAQETVRSNLIAGRAMTDSRRLAAILAPDVVGYSRLTGADEEGNLERLRTIRIA